MTVPKCPDDELEKIIASEKAPLLARIAELEIYLKEWADGSVQCTVDNHGYRLGKFVNVYDKLVAERDRLKEELRSLQEESKRRDDDFARQVEMRVSAEMSIARAELPKRGRI